MGFADEVRAWTEKAKGREQQLFDGVVDAAFASIVEGSPVTGAPGQPVAEGGNAKLKLSWEKEIIGTEAVIATPVDYAPDVEDGLRNGKPMNLESPVGGFHSVKLTVAGFERIVADEVRKLGA